jgi:serine/threonine protein kinase
MKHLTKDVPLFDQASIGAWDTSSVTDMTSTFDRAISFNQASIGDWDTSNVRDMVNLFYGAESFNQASIGAWDTSAVTDFSFMFFRTSSFNQFTIEQWDVSAALTRTNSNKWMFKMFNPPASSVWSDFGQHLRGPPCWYIESIGTAVPCIGDFTPRNTAELRTAAQAWNDNPQHAIREYGPIGGWSIGQVANLSGVFEGLASFDAGDVALWNISHVTDMSRLFAGATSMVFDTALDKWDTSQVTSMANLFYGATADLGRIGLETWSTQKVVGLSEMFAFATNFEDKTAVLKGWDTASCTDASGMFYNAALFNGDVSSWQTSAFKTTNAMFQGATAFAPPNLSKWDLAQVTSMVRMFFGAANLNDAKVNAWDTGSVTDISGLFDSATCFNQPLEWDTAKVQRMSTLFAGATKFNQPKSLKEWDTLSVGDGGMGATFSRSGLEGNEPCWHPSSPTRPCTQFVVVADKEAPRKMSGNPSLYLDVKEAMSAMTGSAYRVAPLRFNLELTNFSSGGMGQVTFRLDADNATASSRELQNWFINAKNGDITGTFEKPGKYNFTLIAVDGGLEEDTVETYHFEVKHPPKFTVVTKPRSPTNDRSGVVDYGSQNIKYIVGKSYRIAPRVLDLGQTSVSKGSSENIRYTLRGIQPNSTDDWFVSAASGELFGKFVRAGPFSIWLMAVDEGGQEAEVEKYTFAVSDADTFALRLGQFEDGENGFFKIIDSSALTNTGSALILPTMVPIDKSFRIAPPSVLATTVVSDGAVEDITFTLAVTKEGAVGASGVSLAVKLKQMAMKTTGEIIGNFVPEEHGTYTIVVTAIDGGGQRREVRKLKLQAEFQDVHPNNTKASGPNNRTCGAHGAPIEADGDEDPFDGSFACDCDDRVVGSNCETLCENGESKDGTKCLRGLPAEHMAAVVGSLVGMLVLIMAVVKYRAHRKSMQPIDFGELNHKMLENGTITNEQLVGNRKPRELKRLNIVFLEQVGSGAFGAVWKATLDESSATSIPEYQVAAKTVLLEGTPSAVAEASEDLTTEAAVMAQLAGHKNLVSIIGVVTSGRPLILVLTYCDHGSLVGHLIKRVATGKPVLAGHKVDFGAQIARGMEHLSGRHFIHRDLAARNVLLASGQSVSNLVCKVADFGLSRAGSCGGDRTDEFDNGRQEYYRSQRGMFPVRWTAPEAMEELKFTHASDVWSFGIVVIEIIQDGASPFPTIKSNPGVFQFTIGGGIHPKPLECEIDALMADFYQLARTCFVHSPAARPDFGDLSESLERLACMTGDADCVTSNNQIILSRRDAAVFGHGQTASTTALPSSNVSRSTPRNGSGFSTDQALCARPAAAALGYGQTASTTATPSSNVSGSSGSGFSTDQSLCARPAAAALEYGRTASTTATPSSNVSVSSGSVFITDQSLSTSKVSETGFYSPSDRFTTIDNSPTAIQSTASIGMVLPSSDAQHSANEAKVNAKATKQSWLKPRKKKQERKPNKWTAQRFRSETTNLLENDDG